MIRISSNTDALHANRAAIVGALSVMEAITLGEMDRVRLMNRVDTKYVFGLAQLPGLLESVANDYRVLQVEGCRESHYETLYFDTDEHACFLEHHNGKLNRYKYRMRRYASSGLCFFEVKRKDNKGRTDKRREPIAEIVETLPEESARFAEEVSGRELLLRPKLWTDFCRITLVGCHAPERVTIDTGVAFRSGDRTESTPELVIAEVKQEQACRDAAIRQRLRERGIRPMRLSKYCLGSALLKPELKQNKFKSKIAKVLRIA